MRCEIGKLFLDSPLGIKLFAQVSGEAGASYLWFPNRSLGTSKKLQENGYPRHSTSVQGFSIISSRLCHMVLSDSLSVSS